MDGVDNRAGLDGRRALLYPSGVKRLSLAALQAAVLASALVLPSSAAKKKDDPIDASFRKATVLIEAGQYDEARAELDLALGGLKRDDARMVRYHERTGAAFLREGKTEQARVSFTAALKSAQRLKVSGDDVARAYAGMGLCLRKQGNDAYAKRFFEKAQKLDPDEGTRMFLEDQIREIDGKPPTL